MAQDRAGAGLTGGVVALLGLTLFFNYVDRGSLPVAAPELARAVGLQPDVLGALLSAFYWTYAPAQIAAGWLVQRFEVRWVLLGGLATWSVATMLCAVAGSVPALFGLRLLLGAGESVIFPAIACLLARHADPAHRARTNALIFVGMAVGPSVGTLGGGLLMARFGWQAVFLVLGGLSLLLVLPWSVTRVGGAGPAPVAALPPPPYAVLLRNRSLWGAALGQFCYAYPPFLVLAWLPFYLVRVLHQPVAQAAWVGAAVLSLSALTNALSGTGADALIRRGARPTRVHKTALVTGLTISAASMALGAVGDGTLALVGVALGSAGVGVAMPHVFVVAQTIAGPRAAGRWMGIQGFIGNLAGVTAPWLTGVLVARTGGFSAAFLAASGICLVGALCWALLVREVEEAAWATAPAAAE